MALSTALVPPSSSNRLKALPLRPLSNEAAVTGASPDLWLRDAVFEVDYVSCTSHIHYLRLATISYGVDVHISTQKHILTHTHKYILALLATFKESVTALHK